MICDEGWKSHAIYPFLCEGVFELATSSNNFACCMLRIRSIFDQPEIRSEWCRSGVEQRVPCVAVFGPATNYAGSGQDDLQDHTNLKRVQRFVDFAHQDGVYLLYSSTNSAKVANTKWESPRGPSAAWGPCWGPYFWRWSLQVHFPSISGGVAVRAFDTRRHLGMWPYRYRVKRLSRRGS